MASENERLEVLKLVEAKQVTPEEATRLLAALSTERRLPESPPVEPRPWTANGRWFKLKVEEPGGQNVNLTLPLMALPAILRAVQRWVPEEHRDTLEAVTEALDSDFRGELLHMHEPGGQSIRIWIE